MIAEKNAREMDVHTLHSLPPEASWIVFQHYCNEEWEIENELRRLGFSLDETDYGDQDWTRYFTFTNPDDVLRFAEIGGYHKDWGWCVDDKEVSIPRIEMYPTLVKLRDIPTPA